MNFSIILATASLAFSSLGFAQSEIIGRINNAELHGIGFTTVPLHNNSDSVLIKVDNSGDSGEKISMENAGLINIARSSSNEIAQTGKRMFSLTGDDKTGQLPFISVNNLVVVSARLNGIPVNLILDTGCASNLLIDPRTSRMLGQSDAKEVTFTGPGKGQKEMQARVLSGLVLEMDNIIGHNLTMVATATKPEFIKRKFNLPIHGVLGYPFFVQFVVTIDYHKKMLTITEANHFVPALEALELPISLFNAKPVVTTSLTNGKHTFPGRLLIDTGASYDLILHDELGKQMIRGLPVRRQESSGEGFGGSISGRDGWFTRLRIGPLPLRNVHAFFPEQGQYFNSVTCISGYDGSIGNGLLKDFLITIDYFRQVLYFQKPGGIAQAPYIAKDKAEKPLLLRHERGLMLP
jgi:hypothetical protein